MAAQRTTGHVSEVTLRKHPLHCAFSTREIAHSRNDNRQPVNCQGLRGVSTTEFDRKSSRLPQVAAVGGFEAELPKSRLHQSPLLRPSRMKVRVIAPGIFAIFDIFSIFDPSSGLRVLRQARKRRGPFPSLPSNSCPFELVSMESGLRTTSLLREIRT